MRITKQLPGTLPMPVHHIVGDWPMSSLGDNVFDLSGRGNNGVINGPTWTEGRFGPALNFGVNTNVNFGDILDELFTTGYVVSVWLNVNSNVDISVRSILNKSDGSSGGGGFFIGQAGTGIGQNKIVVYHFDGAAPSPSFTTTGTMPINQYVNLVVTWNGTTAAGSIKVYFNSVRQAGAEANYGTSPIPNNLILKLGPRVGAALNVLGIVDHLQIYNHIQNSSGIARFYRESFFRYPENRVFAVA